VQAAFEQLKVAMISEPILKHFDPTKEITIETDTSDYAIGAVCSQPDDANVLHPLGYYSRKLNTVELNYDIHDKELLAIMEALNKWGTYYMSTPRTINILSDHKNLEYWQTKRDLNLWQARWSELLVNDNFVITYRRGKFAGKPDILSRESGDSPWEGEIKHRQNRGRILLPADMFWTTTAEVPAETLEVNTADIIKLQVNGELLKEIKDGTARDEEMQDVITKLRNSEWKDSRVTLGLCQEQDGLLTYEGLLWVPNNDQLRLKLLHDHHDSLVAGIPGGPRYWN
jgi:hypothetical protein